MRDINAIAYSLIAGGWLPEDAELLQAEYGFDDDELAEVTAEMTRLFEAADEATAPKEASDIIRRGLYNAAVSLMDDELREKVHDELAPCSETEFLTMYMREHRLKYGIDFIVM